MDAASASGGPCQVTMADSGPITVMPSAVSLVRRLEPSGNSEVDYSIPTWTSAMKLLTSYYISRMGIKRTPESQHIEYWVFEWLITRPSTLDLEQEEKLANQQR